MDVTQRRRSRGQIAIATALVLPALLASLGLAVDTGMAYLLKARLSTAVDAAALAGARAVARGSNQSEQMFNAKQAAKVHFDANISNNYFGSTITWNDPAITFDRGLVTIGTSAQAQMPVRLMQILGFDTMPVAANAQIVRRDLDMVFVIDTSGSLSPVAAQVRSSAQQFLQMFNDSTDRVALIHFSVGAVVDVPFKADQSRGFDRASMNSRIRNYSFSGTTNYSESLWQARDQLNRVIQPANRSSLRTIVFFSDGAPNAFASYFAFRNPADCNLPGALVTGDGGYGTPTGLFRIDAQDQRMSGNCYRGTSIASALTSNAIPAWYNAHDVNDRQFALAPNPSGMRTVTSAPTWTNINRAARNLAEQMAGQSRREGIYVYTLGLGPDLNAATGPDNERGEVLLKNMARTVDSTKFNRPEYAGQPVGQYCWAATTAGLGPCFAELASQILRLTQ
jgi:Flp pilus assembly protein TadG